MECDTVKPAATTGSISPHTLASRIGTPACPRLIDVRRREAFEQAERLVASAAWCDHRLAPDWADSLRGQEVVVYCVHGQQVSRSAAAALQARGIEARFLDGGIEAFIEAGGATLRIAPGGRWPAPRGSRWVTDSGSRVDRMACAWFVRRFIDPDAVIHTADGAWVEAVAEELQAIPFAARGADTLACFDAFLAEIEGGAPALHELAGVVRAADADEPTSHPLAPGLASTLQGLCLLHDGGDERLARTASCLDGLYAWCRMSDAQRSETEQKARQRGGSRGGRCRPTPIPPWPAASCRSPSGTHSRSGSRSAG